MAGSTKEYQRDESVHASLKAGDQAVMRELYAHLQDAFCRFIVVTFKCSYQRARDIYPESFSIMYFNIQRGRLTTPLRSSLKTYLCSVGKYLYYRRYLDRYAKGRIDGYSEDRESQAEAAVDAALIKKERAGQLRKLLNRLGEPCKTILEQAYFQNISFVVMSEQSGIAEGTLRKRKYDCLRKLRGMIKSNKEEL